MKKIFILLSIAAVLIGVSACGTAKTDPTATPAAADVNKIIATGNLLPNQYMYLAFLVRARVDTIPVKVGDAVRQGDVLMTLKDTAQVETSLAAASASLLAAQQDYDTLIRTADYGQAQAWLAWLSAQKGRQAAERAWENLDLDAISDNIDFANEVVEDRLADLNTARDNYDPYKNLDKDDPTRIDYENRLTIAQNNYNEAVRRVEELTASRDSVKAGLNLAMASEQEALRSYQNTLDGADVDKLSLAKAGLDAAAAAFSAAQAVLDQYTLTAPFDGTIVDINLQQNELAGPEKFAVVIVDYSSWHVETNDLSELDIVNIKQGQAVTLKADALASVVMNGTVERISDNPNRQINDVLYTVHILVKDPDPQIKWGMTVEITFPMEQE